MPALVPHGDFVDLATPFVVVGAAVLVLRALATRGAPLAVAVLSGIFYVSGQGIHLAANSIATEEPVGRVARVADFWDEHLGHIWWHLGWLGLLLAFSLAEHTTPERVRLAGPARALATLLLAFTLFTNTVEGQTWWLGLAAAAPFGAWAVRERRPLLATVAAAFVLDAVLVLAWAIWHHGLPQFSDLGWL